MTQSYDPARFIADGNAVLGIEFGSTRIKATLIGPDFKPLAAGSHGWENQQIDGIWTYSLNDAWSGVAACFRDLQSDVKTRHGVSISQLASIGISGMMHGYLPFNEAGELLVPFRTWRNNITGAASEALGARFSFPIPQRWSVAHLYQAILNGEEHVGAIRHLTTLAGYIHWKLTGAFVLGPDEASGMFPVDPQTRDFDTTMRNSFDELIAGHGYSWKLADILPEIRGAGTDAGVLTDEGARLLDPTGTLQGGSRMCPPEGDAGTGMVATNSVRPKTGNVSAGTSVFAMLVLEESLKGFHSEIDIVVTPDGSPVGMAHSNNCTSDFDAWVGLIGEAAKELGASVDGGELFSRLMPLALEGDRDAGGLVVVPYVSGEHVTGFTEGRPLFVRTSGASFTLGNFVRAHLFSAIAAMRTGLDILTKAEGVQVEEIRGHGGYFKTPEVGQRMMAAATNTRCSVMETAGEGGAWGMALLAAYAVWNDRGLSLPDYLDEVFADSVGSSIDPDPADVAGFEAYFASYTAALGIERAAVDSLPSE